MDNVGRRQYLSTDLQKADRIAPDLPIIPGVIDLDRLLARHDGVLHAREHRRLKSSLSRWCRAGRLVRVLPGTYVHPSAQNDFDTRLRAVTSRMPAAVVAGSAAARLTLWPKEEVPEIELLVRARRVPRPGFRFVRRRVPPEQLIQRGELLLVAPAQLAVDAAASDNGAHIDDLMRDRWPLAHIESALTACPGRRGNRTRRNVVRRSRTQPWSQAERRLHDLLDRHHITGWTANLPVATPGGVYCLDVAFEEQRVALEVDGFEFHSSRGAFEYDRARANDLGGDRWRFLRVTWLMLDDEDRLVRWILGMVRPRSRRAAPPRSVRARVRALGRAPDD